MLIQDYKSLMSDKPHIIFEIKTTSYILHLVSLWILLIWKLCNLLSLMYLIISSCWGVITWCCILCCTVFLPLEWKTGLGMLKCIRYKMKLLTAYQLKCYNIQKKYLVKNKVNLFENKIKFISRIIYEDLSGFDLRPEVM